MRYSEVARDAQANEPLLIDVKEAGRRLGLKVWVVRDLCASGELRAGKVGREWKISPDSVLEYVQRLTAKVPEEQAS